MAYNEDFFLFLIFNFINEKKSEKSKVIHIMCKTNKQKHFKAK